jgi:spore germination protein GerM
LVAAALATAAGCGLPVSKTPQAIPAGEIPVALREISQPPPPPHKVTDSTPVDIWLLGADNRLVGVTRYIRSPATPQKILQSLEAGPLYSELNVGIHSAIPPIAKLGAGPLSGGVLTVYLDTTFGSLPPGQATYEFAQIVYSVTSLPAVTGVLFVYEGAELQPEIGTGAIAPTNVVNRADYQILAS